jgi:hypothetical protein
VEANTAPIIRATVKATPKIGATARATMNAVSSTPGSASRASPPAVREITRSEMPVPPWKRIIDTPIVKRSWAPAPSSGLETMPSTEGPIKAPTATSTIISGMRRKVEIS